MSSSPSPRSAYLFEQLAPAPEPQRPQRAGDERARAQELIVVAEREAEQIREDARREGHEQGFRAGREEALAQTEPAGQALAEALAETREVRANAAEEIEREAVELALQVAQRIVSGSIAVEPERVLDVIRGALRGVVERERVVLHVNPDDLELVSAGVAELTASLGGIEHVEVHEERRVERGGAIVRTIVGEIDANLLTKLERVREVGEPELRR